MGCRPELGLVAALGDRNFVDLAFNPPSCTRDSGWWVWVMVRDWIIFLDDVFKAFVWMMCLDYVGNVPWISVTCCSYENQ